MTTRERLAAGHFKNKVPYGITREEHQAWGEAEAECTQAVIGSLEAEHDMMNHPKRDRLWAKAWEHGHWSGYHEVISYYEDFLELVK